MKQTLKLCSLALMLSCLSPLARAQNCINGISTNPKNPKDPVFIDWVNQYPPYSGSVQHNPFLNTFDWQDPFNRIDISPLLFNIPGANPNVMYGMQHPFNGGLAEGSPYNYSFFNSEDKKTISVKNRDFHWEDGWELLWMNLGYTPDGSAIDNQQPGSPFHGQNTTKPDPNHIPYFVLYNKYRGVIRIFASVFFNPTVFGRHQKIDVNLKFTDNTTVNGMLRHASTYDQALDKETIGVSIKAPTSQATSNTGWLLADFLWVMTHVFAN